LALTPGNYWLGELTGGTAGVAGFRSGGGSRLANNNNFASGPSNPFGQIQFSGAEISLYATYTVAQATPTPTSTPTITPLGSIVITAAGNSVDIVSVPAGTTSIVVAAMTDMQGDSPEYTCDDGGCPPLGKDLSPTTATFTPPSDHPVVAMIALNSSGNGIGNWSARVQTGISPTPTPTPTSTSTPTPTPTTSPTPPPPTGMIVGMNGPDANSAAQQATANTFLNAVPGTWVREGFDYNLNYCNNPTESTSMEFYPCSISAVEQLGFHNILGLMLIDHSEALDSLTPQQFANWGMTLIKAYPQINVWEVENEAYYMTDGNASTYGAQYLQMYNTLQASGITGKTLLFDDWGDYDPTGASGWSQDAAGNGWLHDAVTANPGLANALRHEAFSYHAYGPVNLADAGQDEKTPYALNTPDSHDVGPGCPNGCDVEIVAQRELGMVPPIWLTEENNNPVTYGVNGAETGDPGLNSPCSTQHGAFAYLQAEAFNLFAADPHVAAVMPWDALDMDGFQGFVNNDGSSRPALQMLSEFVNYNSSSPPKPSCFGQ
jgi:hypothetical protein